MLLRFGGILFVLMLVLWLYCLLDAFTTDKSRVRSLSKTAWVLIVLLTFEIGAVLWLVFGRPRKSDRSAPGAGRRTGRGRGDAWAGWPRQPPSVGGRPAPKAPDDDPEFLARLDRQVNEEHQHLLDQWEADLRRREEELKRREGGEDGKARPED